MKRLFLVLLVFGLSVPAGAEVLIYNSRTVGVEFNNESGQWSQGKVNEKAYSIVDTDTDINTANIWKVNTRLEKTINGTLKFAETNYAGEFDFIEAPIGEDTIWIISGLADGNERDFLMGEAKLIKIDNTISTVARKLDGTSIWDQNNESGRSIGSAKVSMRLDTKLSAMVQGLGPEEAIEEINDYLIESKGYVDCNANPCLCNAEWETEAPMLTARKYFTGAAIDGKIYVFGGYNSGTFLKSTEVYDPATRQWAYLADNNQGVIGITSAAVNGKFYVFGAWNGHSTINFNEMYDPVADTWTTLTQKPTPVFDAVATVYNGEIYLFGGGYNEGHNTTYSAAVECYNPAANTWRFVTNMPELLGFFAIATVGNKAFLFGGTDLNSRYWNTFDDVISYDFDMNSWDASGFAHLPREENFWTDSAAPVIDGKVYLIGGETLRFSAGSLIGDIKLHITYGADIFNPLTNTWGKAPFLPAKLYNYAVSAVGQKIYVLGGGKRNSSLSRAEVFSFDTQLCSP